MPIKATKKDVPRAGIFSFVKKRGRKLTKDRQKGKKGKILGWAFILGRARKRKVTKVGNLSKKGEKEP